MPSDVRRMRQLDVLRAVAVMLVLGHHAGAIPTDLPRPLTAIMTHWQCGGWAGVDLFFVLSGFLVSGLLFGEYRRRRSLSVGRFLVRRGLKIYPPFYFFLIVQGAWMTFVLGEPPPLRRVIYEALFVQNLFGGVFIHTWSLGVEEQFYLSLPLLLLILLRLGRGRENPFSSLAAIVIFIAVALPALRLMQLFPRTLKMDALMFGVLLAYLHHYHAGAFASFVRRWRWVLLSVGVLLVSPSLKLPYDNWLIRTLGTTPLYVGFGAILMFTMSCTAPAAGMADHAASLLAAIGRYSYSIYLWHMTVRYLFWREDWQLTDSAAGFMVVFPVYIVLSIVMGVAMSRLVEMPVLALRDRWFPSLTRQAVRELQAEGDDGGERLKLKLQALS